MELSSKIPRLQARCFGSSTASSSVARTIPSSALFRTSAPKAFDAGIARQGRAAAPPRRTYSTRNPLPTVNPGRNRGGDWAQRGMLLQPDKMDEYRKYPWVTAEQLRTRRNRPKRVKMLMRDFIDDSLYNPHYGYFPRQAVIFTPGEQFDFENLADEPAFYKALGERYTQFEDELDKVEYNETRQLWHTPTELFKPFYGEAIARYLVTNYKLSLYPHHDLLIYEMGAGNGTLMLNILDYIRQYHPDVYQCTRFRIIEISSALASLQMSHLEQSAHARGHMGKVEIINKSVFEWDSYVASPCFFIAMEVFDNFAHDVIRYDYESKEPLQGSVLIDEVGDFYEFYDRKLDPLAARFLRVRHAACGHSYPHPLFRIPEPLRKLYSALPFSMNLSTPEYIPTRLLQFFDMLQKHFPAHRLITSDFHSLPDAIPGINGPVVQTRYRRRTVPVSTPLVHQGFFDILFPTDFDVMENVYRAVTGKLTKVHTHEDFLRRWSFVAETATKSGENPMLSAYANASVLTTL